MKILLLLIAGFLFSCDPAPPRFVLVRCPDNLWCQPIQPFETMAACMKEAYKRNAELVFTGPRVLKFGCSNE